jgi:hypothetical protein
MNKIKLLACLSMSLNIFSAETTKQNTSAYNSPLNIALNAIQNRTNTLPHEVCLSLGINEPIAGGPLLHHAVLQGKINWVKSLIQQNADVNKLSNCPQLSPLEIAASVSMLGHNSLSISQLNFDRFKIIKLLIENRADPRRPDISELLPEFIASNDQVNKALQQIRALIVSRQGALNKCDEFLACIKSAKLNSAEIRALPLYQIYADNNPPLKAYLDKLEQQENKTQGQKRPKAKLPETKPLKMQRTEILTKREP